MTICSWKRQSAERFVAWKYQRGKSVVLLTLAAGVVIPAIRLFLQPLLIRSSLRGST
jgi:hypothetical protein